MNGTSSIVCEQAATAPPPGAGDLVGGRYRLVRPLGEGGMGLVFEAEHLRLRQSVAIKFLRPEVLAMPDAIERFEREARASCRMRGPHVVHVLDVDTDELGRPFMVMELLRGRDLEAELRARGALPVTEAVDWVLQACAAVAEAHQAGIIHRDLKPSNLFLAEEFGTRVVKVLDFGISKISVDAEPAVTGVAVTMGTPLYMSPEQVRSSRDVDGRTDVWSLGVILYELIAGAPPFLGTTTAAIAAIVADATPGLRESFPHVPPELERVVMTALAKAPDARFPTAEAVAAALVPYASVEGATGPYSLRPSQRAFEIASLAMARAPAGHRATNATELLRLTPSRPSQPDRPRLRWETGRAIAATLAVGVAVAAALSMGVARSSEPAADALGPGRRGEAPTLPSDVGARSETLPVDSMLPDAASSAVLTTVHSADPIAPTAFPPRGSPAPSPPPAPRRSAAPAHARIERPLYL
jgi:eukaryotic-like serine/threonine-protein kinase